MSSTTRIPKAEITGLYGWMVKRFSRKLLGDVPESVEVMWHHRPALKLFFGLGSKSDKWNELDPNLKSFAHMAVASLVGCSWCLDFGYFRAHNEGLDEVKASEVPRWRESPVFSSLERDVMEYAEAMTETPTRVTDELSARLLDQLGAPAMVELTAGWDWRTCTRGATRRWGSRRRASPRRAHCRWRNPRPGTRRPHERGRVRTPPQPAVHRRVRDARLGLRRRGRRPGDVAALGRRRSRRGPRPRAPTWSASSPVRH